MSLINEALKRARVEAARRDAAAKGVPAEALPVYVPPRRRGWLAPAAGFAAGLAIVGIGLGAFWLVRRPAPVEQARTASPIPAEAAETVAGTDDVPAPASSQPATPPAATSSPPAVQSPPPAVQAPPPVVERPPPAVQLPPPAAASARDVPVVEAPAPAPSPPPTAPVARAEDPLPASESDGGIPSYMHQAAPAGTVVKIDFIVWSESNPFAQINGQQISAGQRVDGYTLLKVERERVELEGAGQRFWLRVK